MPTTTYIVCDRKQSLWQSLVSPIYEVRNEDDENFGMTASLGKDPKTGNRRIRLVYQNTSGVDQETYDADLSQADTGGSWGSYTIVEAGSETKLALVIAGAGFRSDVPIMSEEERGYPALWVKSRGDDRCLVLADDGVEWAWLHRDDNDQRRKPDVIGCFDLAVALTTEEQRIAMLIATIEAILNLERPKMIVLRL